MGEGGGVNSPSFYCCITSPYSKQLCSSIIDHMVSTGEQALYAKGLNQTTRGSISWLPNTDNNCIMVVTLDWHAQGCIRLVVAHWEDVTICLSLYCCPFYVSNRIIKVKKKKKKEGWKVLTPTVTTQAKHSPDPFTESSFVCGRCCNWRSLI